MMDNEDWQKDSLSTIVNGSPKFLKLKSPKDNQNDQWHVFHFATRLKLDGADFFCRQALGAASRPHDLGLPLLADRQLKWYLDAFFFELLAACDTLLQELNVVYAYDLQLEPKNVRWDEKKKNKFMKKLPQRIFNLIEAERKKDWFCKVQWYRNTATHHYYVPLSSGKIWVGDILNFSEHAVKMNYVDNAGSLIQEEIKVCNDYLLKMVRYIRSVWEKMAQEFD